MMRPTNGRARLARSTRTRARSMDAHGHRRARSGRLCEHAGRRAAGGRWRRCARADRRRADRRRNDRYRACDRILHERGWSCTADHGRACCRGAVVSFIDGVCNTAALVPACRIHVAYVGQPDASSDAGVDLDAWCASDLHAEGCPCTAGTTACNRCGHRVTCEGGTYVGESAEWWYGSCGGCF